MTDTMPSSFRYSDKMLYPVKYFLKHGANPNLYRWRHQSLPGSSTLSPFEVVYYTNFL